MVIEAHSEGKVVQSSSKSLSSAWRDADSNGEFNFIGFNYRVKPVPKYILETVYIMRRDESFKMVSINALADALGLVAFGLCDTEDYKALKELL